MTTITPEKLAELREKAQAAAPGLAKIEVCDLYSDAVAEFIAAANPQTVLALVDEVERLRDIETDLLVCDADCRDLQALVAELRDSNAKVTDARDNLLDEVGRLREMESTLRAIVRDLNIARGDSGSKIGLGGAYCGVVSLIREDEALRKALEEREADMHSRIRAGYDKTVADSWRTANEKLQARVAELEKNQ